MRKVHFVVLFFAVSAVSLAVWASQFGPEPSSRQRVRVLVRVSGTSVRFRTYPPSSLNIPNVRWYTTRRETFIADDRAEGASEHPGERGYWYHLVNLASEERGWVFADYVVPIHEVNKDLLTRVGTYDESQAEPSWSLQDLASIAQIASFFIPFPIFLVIYKIIRRLKTKSSIRRLAQNLANDNANDPRLNREPSPIVFGTSGGTSWLYQPKVRPQGGGFKSA
jgi:hypothetical protein